MSSPVPRLPNQYRRPVSSADRISRRLWFLSNALAFLVLTIGILDVSAAPDQGEDIWKGISGHTQIDDKLDSDQGFQKVRQEYYDLFLKESVGPNKEHIKHHADLCARVQLRPNEYDTVQCAFWNHYYQHLSNPKLKYRTEKRHSFSQSHHEAVQKNADDGFFMSICIKPLLPDLMKSADTNKMLEQLTVDGLSDTLVSNLLAIYNPPVIRAAHFFTAFRYFVNPTAQIPSVFLEYADKYVRDTVKNYEKWHGIICKDIDWNAGDSVREYYPYTINNRQRVEAWANAAVALGNLEAKDYKDKDIAAIELCRNCDILNLDIADLEDKHVFLKSQIMKKAKSKWAALKKTTLTADDYYNQLISQSELGEPKDGENTTLDAMPVQDISMTEGHLPLATSAKTDKTGSFDNKSSPKKATQSNSNLINKDKTGSSILNSTLAKKAVSETKNETPATTTLDSKHPDEPGMTSGSTSTARVIAGTALSVIGIGGGVGLFMFLKKRKAKKSKKNVSKKSSGSVDSSVGSTSPKFASKMKPSRRAPADETVTLMWERTDAADLNSSRRSYLDSQLDGYSNRAVTGGIETENELATSITSLNLQSDIKKTQSTKTSSAPSSLQSDIGKAQSNETVEHSIPKTSQDH
eukprot:GHVT01052076.1.p1 GENE.GHVT01052076.1~~GHVT01052076.1.p1  ORF type:complete len:643 (+),score=41.09 GHVT01052076.1:23-1930(+)